jgi:hypothetical protein
VSEPVFKDHWRASEIIVFKDHWRASEPVFKDHWRANAIIVSKHKWSLNTGKIYIECTTVVIEKEGLLTQVVS